MITVPNKKFMKKKFKSFLKKKHPNIYEIARRFHLYAYFKLRKIQHIPKHLFFRITKNKNIVEKMLIDFPMIHSAMVSKN